ncbi:SusD/RagB family nutrient-binding outer membrane lipoprotein [Sphingobacterium deserti]|uniref:Lipoprotein n=1 Tax=Sphingobacterium deserti TaxID=1229276 RepID=A0A0B8T453_9SPHI|nr:SusD/RagB family nutrient-binding outer membrane lipoprotein [Sphingobacterium deserti]KGE16166.1 hypothetical protein DI53_0281 [Sphingobacterium deserti]
MKNKNKINYVQQFLTIVLLTISAACTKNFEELNTNPAGVSDEQANADFALIASYLAQAQRDIIPEDVGEYQLANNLSSDTYGGYFASQTPYVGNANNLTYSLVPGWYSAIWVERYIRAMNPLYRVGQITRNNDQLQDIFAFSLVLKVAAMHRTAEKVGPIIYSQYNMPDETGQIAYDSQEEAYNRFFLDLDTASTILQGLQEQATSSAMSRSDLAYSNNNYRRWLKFANTLRLRLALRVVYVSPQLAQAEGEKALNPENGGLLEDNADNCSIALSLEHPLNIITSSWSDVRMGASIESILGGYNDPRLPKNFLQAADPAVAGQYKGIRTGINIDAKSRYDGYSRLIAQPQRMQLMVAPESWFLRAEAALRGWSNAGSAQANYETGIRRSFEMYNISGETAAYLQNTTLTPRPYIDPKSVTPGQNDVTVGSPYLSTVTIAWDEGATNDKKLERIITQKWIAVFPDGDEAWAEYRRTGYPILFPVVVNNSGGTIQTIPGVRRFPYPEREYNSNRAAVARAIQLLGGPDNGGTRLWWDVVDKSF